MRTLLTILGTRPQYIKYAAMSAVLHDAFDALVVDTGQHYDASLSGQLKREFQFGDELHTLDTGRLGGAERFASMLAQLDSVIGEHRPDAILCFGDTDSTLAAGLAAVRRQVPLCHVEAGERGRRADGSRVPTWVVPEEGNRVMVDHLASLLCCTTTDAAAHCADDACQGRAVVTGDIMYDLYLRSRATLPPPQDILTHYDCPDTPYYLCTIHRPVNSDDPARLSSLLSTLNNLPHPVLLPLHPRTAERMRRFDIVLSPGALRLLPPLSHGDLLGLLSGAERVLTDSGGVTREAYFRAVPSLCLDDITAWTVLLRTGWCTLTGADANAIHTALHAPVPLLYDNRLFGDGNASARVIEALRELFA